MATPAPPSVFRWRILTDRPVERSADDSFGIHSTLAGLLYELATTCTTPFTVGLYGGWGTGKTSVVQILKERALKGTPSAFGYVYLDIWKFVSDPLKRWVLLETERQLVEQKILSDYNFQG